MAEKIVFKIPHMDHELTEIEKPTAQQVAWVFSKINEFIFDGGGTYRDLIYFYMGFKREDFQTLLHGQEITNLIDECLEMRQNNSTTT